MASGRRMYRLSPWAVKPGMMTFCFARYLPRSMGVMSLVAVVLPWREAMAAYHLSSSQSHSLESRETTSAPRWHGTRWKVSGISPEGVAAYAHKQPSRSRFATGRSSGRENILEPIPTIPAAKQVRCWPCGSRELFPDSAKTVFPEKRMSEFEGTIGRKNK